MRLSTATPSLITLLLLLVTSSSASAADWPQFRGPDRNGISGETGLVSEWGEGGPKELWRVPIGAGFSAIAAVGDRVFTLGSDESSEFAVAFNTASGERLWRTEIGGLFENDFGNGPRSTPTYDGGVLFLVASLGHLTALDAETGALLWKRDLRQDFDSPLPNWAFSTSPLVLGGSVIVEIGGTENRTIGAFDRKTGELQWTGGSGEIAYSSPIVVPFNGTTQIVFLTKNGLSALSPEGETIWTSEFVPELGIKPAPPVFVAPDLLFASASYDAGAKAVRMIADGSAVKVEDVWQHPLMRNHFNGSVAIGEHLCGFDKAFLKCIEAATGEQTWIKRGLGKGSLIVADGKMIALSERGKLVLLEADPLEAKELASHQALTGRCWTQPTLSNGVLFLRNGTEMVAYDLSSN
jgi:outer membrane protein assembly factor BamB